MSSINASVGSGIAYNSDSTATLNLGTGGVTAAAIDASQNITTTNDLNVGRNLNIAGSLTFSGNSTGNITLASNVAISSNLAVSGNITVAGSPVPNMTQLYVYTMALG